MDPTTLERDAALLLAGTHHDPHGFLGLHPAAGGLVMRVWAPGAERVELLERGGRRAVVELARAHPAGLWTAELPRGREPFPYRLRFERDGGAWERDDPYRFGPTLGEQDLHFIGEGSHRRLWDALGAHAREIDGAPGVAFAVWAPNARGVSLVGDLNAWDRRAHPMRSLGASGVWELFVQGIGPGERYKYAVRGADGVETERADPLAFAAELRPRTASVVADLGAHAWTDAEWMEARRARDPLREPMSVYEVHLGSWRRAEDGSWLSYPELAEQLAAYATEHGFTHIELLPISEHPYDGSWGYQVTGFYAPTARFGGPGEFQAFVDRLHRAGLGVIVDWVPAHFAVDAYALARFDGTYLYEHEDPRRRVQPDWGTLSFNYGRREVRNFLAANAMYWLREYHIDGLRIDGVSSMLYLDYSREPGGWSPNIYGGREHLEAVAFLRELNALVDAEGEGAITVAEESTAWPGVTRPTYAGGLGFRFKWNMGWMHDALEYFGKDPIHRRHHHGTLTFSTVYTHDERYVLALSHDEVVHGKRSLLHKMPGDEWRQFANLRLLFALQHAHPGKKLIFMGMEWGQRGEWNEAAALEWGALHYAPHAQVRDLVRDLNRLHRECRALHELDHDPRGFAWLDGGDAENSVLAWVRHAEDPADYVICVMNFTPVARYGYRIPTPEAAPFREALNTDAAEYGGSGVGNLGSVAGEAVPYLGRPCSATLTLPPLGALFLAPERE